MVVAIDGGINGRNDIEPISSDIEMENHDGNLLMDIGMIRIKQERDISSQEDRDSLASLLEDGELMDGNCFRDVFLLLKLFFFSLKIWSSVLSLCCQTRVSLFVGYPHFLVALTSHLCGLSLVSKFFLMNCI